MVYTKPPKNSTNTITPNTIESSTNQLELQKEYIKIHQKQHLKNQITTDYILSKLNEKDKEFIINITNTARKSGKLYDKLIQKSTNWEWNKERYRWDVICCYLVF